jgi:hypothetical protein
MAARKGLCLGALDQAARTFCILFDIHGVPLFKGRMVASGPAPLSGSQCVERDLGSRPQLRKHAAANETPRR